MPRLKSLLSALVSGLSRRAAPAASALAAASGGESAGHAGHDVSLRSVLLRPATQTQINHRNVIVDAIGVGITAGVGSFLSVFLVRIGATNFQVGLLTAMPALTGMLLAMPVGEFLARRSHIVPWFARSRFAVLSCYVLTGLVPFFIPSQAQPEAIIVIWALATIPQTIVSVAFTVVMGGVAGPSGRLALMSHRWSTLGLTNSITVVLVGQVLSHFNFPLNYQVVFIGSAIGALISVVFSSSIRLPAVQTPQHDEPLVSTLRQHGRTLSANGRFVRFTISQFVFRGGLALAAPLFPIYWVRNIQASDAAISAINSTQTFIAMAGYYLWSRVTQRRGQRWVLLVTTLGLSFYPLLTSLTHTMGPLVFWAGLAGLFSSGVDLVFFDILLGSCPGDQQPAYIGMYQTTAFMATFLAPLAGTALSTAIGIPSVLVLATALRLVGFALMALLAVGRRAH